MVRIARVSGCGAVMAFAVLSSCAGAQGRAPEPVMQVLAGPGRPSTLLARHLEANREQFVVVDIGLWVQELVGGALGGTWFNLEHDRGEHLRAVLARLCEAMPPPRDGDDVLAGVAHVAYALLTNDAVSALSLVSPWRNEIAAVVNGERAARAWRPGGPDSDWRGARPNGAYTGRIEGLFRATWYLRASLAVFSGDQRAAWDRAIATAVSEDGAEMGNRAALARIDAALGAFLGTQPGPMPGVLGDLLPANAVDRALLAGASHGAWWQRLATVHARGPGEGDDVRTAALRVAHTLAIEAPTDAAWLAGYGLERWRQKWLDLADYTYVGVREVDALAGVLGIGPDPVVPRLLVEPLPRSFAALRAAFQASDALAKAIDPESSDSGSVAEIDDCLTLLAHQQAGTEPPPACVERVWQRLLHGFEVDRDLRPETRLEGIEGPLRRTGCHLVRIPIRWQGKDASAVAFHWCVEHQDADGVWRRAVRDRK